MNELYLFSNHQLKICAIGQKGNVNDLYYQVGDNNAQIRFQEKEIRIEKNQIVIVDGMKCFYRSDDRAWSAISISNQVKIGRNKNCDIQILDEHISNQHILLTINENEIMVKDLDSTNGTYIRGKRIIEMGVAPGECVVVGTIPIIVFPTFLLCQIESKNRINWPVSIIENGNKLMVQRTKKIQEMQPLEMEVDLPRFHHLGHQQSLFQAVGSSVMIFLSGIISTLVLSLSQSSVQNLVPMLVSNGTMGFTFLMFGFYNYRKNRANARNDQFKNQQHYLEYLKKLETTIWQYRESVIQNTRQKTKYYLTFDESMYGTIHPIYITNKNQSWISFKHLKISYEDQSHPLAIELKKFLDIQKMTLLQPKYWNRKQRILLENGTIVFAKYLFLQFIWQAPDTNEKWIWIGSNLDNTDRIFSFPQCQIQGNRLCITNQSDMQKFTQWIMLYPDAHVISFENWPLNVDCKDASICFMQIEKGDDFDGIYSVNEPKLNVDSYLRKVLSSQQVDKEPSFIEGIDIYNYMYQPSSEITLKIPIGYDSDCRVIYLDFHEQKQGPHGLIAGMTGSGKSEWLSSLLMQMVLHNTNEMFQYILIDFKGGAFGKHFYQFPHCAGMITNMEDHLIERFFISLSAEIKSRQMRMEQLYTKNDNALFNIDSYNVYSEQKMSHLFIIVDEFAQLKSKYPEYMDQLKELSRIGRSLGIHLLLATQKPMGVVDEQIWANSRFRICFRVNSKSDSQEVLKNEKAFFLDEVGSYILQVGNEYEQKGKSFYLQQSIDAANSGWIEIDNQDRIIDRNEGNSLTMIQFFSQHIGKAAFKHHWIILPDLFSYQDWKDEFIKIDVPHQQSQIDFHLEMNQTCFIHTQDYDELDSFVRTLISTYQNEPIYLFGTKEYQGYVDSAFEQFEQVEQLSGTVLVFIQNEESITWVNTYGFQEGVRCFIFSNLTTRNMLQLSASCDYVLTLYDKEIDSIRLLFNQHFIPNMYPNHRMGLIRWQQKLLYFTYPQKKIEQLTRDKKELRVNKGLCLGQDLRTQQSVYWRQRKPLLVCFAQQSLSHSILSWLKSLSHMRVCKDISRNADIYVCNMLFDSNLFQREEYILRQYDLDVLWIGLGLRDYSYLIKKNAPMDIQGNAVLYTDDAIKGFQISCLK